MRILALALSVLPVAVQAHPHVFVDATGGFRFQDGTLTGLRIVWQYDEFTTLLLYDQLDLDKDGDGALDEADMAEIVRGETVWEPEYEGDTYLWVNGQKRALGRPQGGAARMEGDTYLWVNGQKRALGRPQGGAARMVGDAVEVSFDLPLGEPVSVSGLHASLKLYDPGYYYAYDVPNAALMLDAPPECDAEVIPFVADAQSRALQDQLLSLSQEDIPDDPNIGARFADELVLQCD